METVRFFRGKRSFSVYGGDTHIATDITIFDTYSCADYQRSIGGDSIADFVVGSLAGTTTVDTLPGHVLISGYTPLLALPMLCEETVKQVANEFRPYSITNANEPWRYSFSNMLPVCHK